MEAVKQIDNAIEASMKDIEAIMKKIEGLKEAKETLMKTFGLVKIEDVLDKETDKETLRALEAERKKPMEEKPKLNWAKAVEEEEEEAKKLAEEAKKQSTAESEISAINKMVRGAVQKRKKFYAILNGPMRGVYDEWSKVAAHVTGVPGINHQSFSTLEEAKEALKNSEPSFASKLLIPAPKESINRLRSLGRIPGSSSSSTISSIPTKAAVETARKITLEKFRDRFSSLVIYKEEYKLQGFYPVWRNNYGPKHSFHGGEKDVLRGGRVLTPKLHGKAGKGINQMKGMRGTHRKTTSIRIEEAINKALNLNFSAFLWTIYFFCKKKPRQSLGMGGITTINQSINQWTKNGWNRRSAQPYLHRFCFGLRAISFRSLIAPAVELISVEGGLGFPVANFCRGRKRNRMREESKKPLSIAIDLLGFVEASVPLGDEARWHQIVITQGSLGLF
ncbi:hypothetical protein CRG98_040680 [Punica granatum]|uniref:Ribonuclease H1 N-terminal domain-containing protein n=1 Tax=Punica granatum TaxID=22663 RepID=A0A2I0I4L1_PUNGR|nr:hypothetical protein CRG98_040680 [Punica granatum]